MQSLLIYLDKEVLKARLLEPSQKLTKPLIWKDMQFEYTTSSLLMIAWPILLPELAPKTARSLLDLVGARYQFSPYHGDLKNLCPELVFKKEFDEWVFFGGSFNPWHKGHQACLNLLPEEKLCLILPDRSPLKELKQIEPVSTIIELVTKIKFGKNHYIAPTFLLDFQKNPTITWIEKLHQDFPQKKLSLLLGFDSLRSIMQWVRPEDLINILDTIYVSSRMENDQERQQVAEPLQKLAPKLKIDFLGRHDYEGLSSTNIRAGK